MPSLLDQFPEKPGPSEWFETLLARDDLKIERIVSHGHASPTDPNAFHDQTQDEFVLLVAGAATLDFPETRGAVSLQPGDWLHIPAREKHRVSWTAPDQATVWLAIHFQ